MTEAKHKSEVARKKKTPHNSPMSNVVMNWYNKVVLYMSCHVALYNETKLYQCTLVVLIFGLDNYRIIHQLLQIKNILVTNEVIFKWFSWVTKSRLKIIGKSPNEWPKIVIQVNECIILFLACHLMSWTHNSAKNNDYLPIVTKDGLFWLSIVTSPQLGCDIM